MRNMSKKTWKLRVWNHMTEMQKLDYRVPVGNFTSIDDVAWLLANGYITLQDARIWCVNTNHSLVDMEQAVGSIRYSQTETTTIPAWHEKKRSWPYRLVAFLNEVIDMFVQAITEDFL